MKSRFHPRRFAVSVLLAATLAALPTYATNAAEGTQVTVQTLYVHVDQPLPGQPIVLPDTVPVEIRPQVLELLAHTPPGQAIVVAPPDAQSQYAGLIQDAVQKAGVVLASGPTTTGGIHPNDGVVLGCLGWLLAIIVIIVIVVIIYVIWKVCQMVPPPQTNAPPNDPYPVVVHPRDLTKSSRAVTLASVDAPTLNCAIEANTDLATSNWWTLAVLNSQQAVDYTNGNTSLIWSVVTARNTNGELLASTIISGASTNALTGERPLQIPYPGPTPDRLFLRLRPY